MKGLIGCEESQAVTLSFLERGHDFYSNDFKPCSGGRSDRHIRMDVIEAINSQEWDFIGLHPDCTKITVSGNRHYAYGKPKHQQRIDAVEWTIKLWELACTKAKMVYMENPIGAMNGDPRLPKPQIIQPFNFNENASKKTCLWLYGLPELAHTGYFKPRIINGKERWANQTDEGQNKLLVDGKWISYNDPLTKTIRSKTYPGIAKAMAEQWG